MNENNLLEVETKVMVFGSAEQLTKIKLQALRLGDCLVRLTQSVRNLGVQFDAEMTMESHMTAVCTSAIFTSATSRGSDGI